MPNYDIVKDNGDYYLSMGLTAEQVANDYKVSRQDQDAFAYASHQKAIRAISEGHFRKGILPITVKETYLNEKGKRATSDVRLYPAPVEALCRAATGLERALLRCGIRFPFGGSLIAVAAKQSIEGDGHA